MKKGWKRGLCLFLTALFLVGSVIIEPEAQAVTKTEINNLKSKRTDLESEMKEIQSKLDALDDEEYTTMATKLLYDEQCNLLNDQIELTETEIDEYNELIQEAQKEYSKAVENEEQQYELMCSRIRLMEERGTISYWEILFEASSFSDLLTRLDFIEEVMAADENIIFEYQAIQAEKQDRQAELQELLDASEEAKAELEAEMASFDEKMAEADALIEAIKADQELYEYYLSQLKEEEDELAEEIKSAEKAYQAQIAAERAAAQRKAASSGSGSGGTTSGQGSGCNGITLTWPCSSHKITSYFGKRKSPGPGASTYHQGIDIGGVGTTTSVVAAAAGTVITSGYSSSAGNWIVISHGNGVKTYYMHLSKRSVSAGTKVSRGQKIGVTGNTGNSFGAHLHFAVSINGTYVNPLTYLP